MVAFIRSTRFQAFLLALVSLMTSVASARPAFMTRDVNDPFYEPPEGFESLPPGTILRSRGILASLNGIIPDFLKASQLLYRTTAINGSAIASVTTVFQQGNGMNDRFISYHIPYDSADPTCSPSYQFPEFSPQTNPVGTEMLIIESYVLQGYIVAVPDYEGPDAAFGAGRLAGIVTLDGMRAVLNFRDALGFDIANPAIVGTGYSGGGIATAWAASLHSSYAPELNIKGWASGGTPVNITGTLEHIDGGLFSGYGLIAINGLAAPSTYANQLNPIINSVMQPLGMEKLNAAKTDCTSAALASFLNMSLFSPDIQSMGESLLYEPTVSNILAQNAIDGKKDEASIAPYFFYHATADEAIPYADVSSLVDSWCSIGVNTIFTTFEAGGHLTTELVAIPNVFDFVYSAFAGNVAIGCVKNSTLTDTLDPLALGLNLEPALIEFIDVLLNIGGNN